MQLPRFTATTPAQGTGLARAGDIGALTRTGGQEFAAIEQAGRAIGDVSDTAFKAHQNREALDDQAFAGEAEKRAFDARREGIGTYAEFDPSIGNTNPTDPKNYYDGTKILNITSPKKDEFRDATYKDFEGKILNLAKGFKDEAARQAFVNRWTVEGYKDFTETGNAKHQEYQEVLLLGNASSAAANGDIELSQQWIDIAEKHGLIGPKTASNEMAKNTKIHTESIINNIKPVLIEAIAQQNLAADGYAALDVITKELEKEGTLTKTEAAQANKSLGDWMDSYVSGRIKQGKEAEKKITRESYEDLMPAMLDNLQSTDRYDLVENSRLSKADKEKWHTYIKGSYKEAPESNTPKGMSSAFSAVYAANTLDVSPQQAYDSLLEARFIEQSITDEQFNWGIDKINNPYPKPILEDMQSILKSNNEDFHGAWNSGADKRSSAKVNESLIAWVDGLIENKQVPAFDFKKKLYNMSSQFRAGDARWYDIGHTLKSGGREYEVVGFDENGEPLVEEIR